EEELLRELRLKYFSEDYTRDDLDVVPIPNDIISFLASARGPCREDLRAVLGVKKSICKGYPRVSRALAQELLDLLPEDYEG
ncbi:MAG: hypothetical protein ACFFD4_40445, partial [Candidatus Odinarchaeota archaeon]